jgi:hypothetical protein
VPNEICIVCSHVFSRKLPALRALRGEASDRNPDIPENEYDGTWQVHCGMHDHNTEEETKLAKCIALRQVREFEPSLEPFLGIPAGFMVTRESQDAPWVVSEIPDAVK